MSSSPAVEPGTAASVLTSSRACAKESPPASSAALTSGCDSSAAAVSSAALAEPAVEPVARAIQSDTSAKPRSSWVPHSFTRRAASTRVTALSFSTKASSSTTAAQSSPECSSGWNETSAARNACANTTRDSATTPPQPAGAPQHASTKQGGGPFCPATSRHRHPIEHAYGCQPKVGQKPLSHNVFCPRPQAGVKGAEGGEANP